MAKSKESFNKREKEKKKAQQKQQKAERAEERKSMAKKGKSLDEMMAYIDENGNISTTPPDPSKRREINVEDIQIGVVHAPEEEEDAVRTGVVGYFNYSKGFGFINDTKTRERIFVHINQISEQLNENDRVSYEIGSGPKGPVAIKVKKI